MSQPQQRRRARAVLFAALAALGLGAWAQPASAQDLIVNEGDPPVELGGGYGYDHVFIDGSTVRFVGDTQINARSIYIGPNVNIAECASPGSDTGCVDARNITLQAMERIVIVPALQLQGGGTSAGGSLYINAKSVATGNITTSGQGQRPSGSITLISSGTVQTGVLQALGAPIVLRGDAGVAVGGGVDTHGAAQIANPPFSAQVGGAFTAVSSAGDIFVGGDVNASGNNTGAAGITGGRGGAVTLDGGDVRLGAIDSSGGTAALGAGGGMGGAAGPVVLNARGSMIALGNVDVSASTGSLPSAGGSVAIKAAAQAATRDINASGANGASPGGAITITAGAISVGQLASIGGNATATPGNGAGGGSIALTSAGNVASGPIVAYGGNTAGAGFGGGGGSVSVSGVNLTVASVMTYAGTSGITGALGGPVSLLASNNLTIPGAINASGASASTTLPVGAAGGRGGAVTLRAANGSLFLGGTVRTVGGAGAPGSGAAKGGPGGNGGAVVVVARKIGELGGLIALGGDAGEAFDEDQAGPGGTGGAITYFGQQPIIGDGLLLVNSDGGDGNPAGAKGFQSQDVAPSGLVIDEATGALTFTGGSPDGDGFTILSTVEKDPTTTIRTTATAGVVPPAPPMCRAVTYQVVATNVALGWVSDPSNAVTWTRPPSAKQACDAPPLVKSGKKTLVKKSKFLKKGKLRLSLSSSGVGSLVVDLMQGKKVLTTATKDIKKAGGVAVDLKLPKAARKPGRYKIRITAKAPTGKKIARTSFILEVTE